MSGGSVGIIIFTYCISALVKEITFEFMFSFFSLGPIIMILIFTAINSGLIREEKKIIENFNNENFNKLLETMEIFLISMYCSISALGVKLFLIFSTFYCPEA